MLEPSSVYHIYNCANGEENLFREEKNYIFFLEKYFQYIFPVAETYAYCLLKNHFHAMVRIREEEELLKRNLSGFQNLTGFVSKQFSNFFNAYAKAFNKEYGRRGSLFQRPFKKKEITSDAYFTQLVLYIHNNPVKHGFVKNLYEWPHSSIHLYQSYNPDLTGLLNLSGLVNTKEVIDWFGGIEWFRKSHEEIVPAESEFE